MSQGTNQTASSQSKLEMITLGGGCFWCLEAVFVELRGVERVESGYAGGTTLNPSYEQICMGTTGHAEVVQVSFNPQSISVRELLEVFFVMHDPTTLNRQGADVGTQYRSVIYYHTPDQKAAAEQVMKQIEQSGIWNGQIITELAPLSKFYLGEDYHQQYYENNPFQPYCQAVILPKIGKLRQHFLSKLKK